MLTQKKLDYKEYLKTPHWQAKRTEAFSKQGNKCRVCGSPYSLNIHHRRYRYKGKSILYKELNQNLLVLCQDCHLLWHKMHGYHKIPFPTLRRLLKAGIPKMLAFQHPYSKAKTLATTNGHAYR